MSLWYMGAFMTDTELCVGCSSWVGNIDHEVCLWEVHNIVYINIIINVAIASRGCGLVCVVERKAWHKDIELYLCRNYMDMHQFATGHHVWLIGWTPQSIKFIGK